MLKLTIIWPLITSSRSSSFDPSLRSENRSDTNEGGLPCSNAQNIVLLILSAQYSNVNKQVCLCKSYFQFLEPRKYAMSLSWQGHLKLNYVYYFIYFCNYNKIFDLNNSWSHWVLNWMIIIEKRFFLVPPCVKEADENIISDLNWHQVQQQAQRLIEVVFFIGQSPKCVCHFLLHSNLKMYMLHTKYTARAKLIHILMFWSCNVFI